MSARAIVWTRRALARLDQIGAYIAADNPDAAARVVAQIVASVNGLAEFPASGRPGRIKTTRELVISGLPYIVPYRVTVVTVEILTVMHSAQQWPKSL